MCEQECIPVGYVPTAAMATPRCQYPGEISVQREGLYPEGESLYGWQKGVWRPPEQNDTRFWKHYLPLQSVNMECCFRSRHMLWYMCSSDTCAVGTMVFTHSVLPSVITGEWMLHILDEFPGYRSLQRNMASTLETIINKDCAIISRDPVVLKFV